MPQPAFPSLYARVRNAVKRRVARWPSAYASAQLVRQYKASVAARYGADAAAYVDDDDDDARKLSRWFREKWVNISTMKPCGSVKTASYYPVCRPERVAKRLTASQIADAVERKQRSRTATTRYAWTSRQKKQ